MSATATRPPTASLADRPTTPTPSLEERIADAERELLDAEEAAGVAVLDGGDEQAAAKRASDARSTLERLRAALKEQVKRDEAIAYEVREHREAVARWRYLAWHVEYLRLIALVIELRPKLADAEAAVMALPKRARQRTGRAPLDRRGEGSRPAARSQRASASDRCGRPYRAAAPSGSRGGRRAVAGRGRGLGAAVEAARRQGRESRRQGREAGEPSLHHRRGRIARWLRSATRASLWRASRS
jgi:hypothetical protein